MEKCITGETFLIAMLIILGAVACLGFGFASRSRD